MSEEIKNVTELEKTRSAVSSLLLDIAVITVVAFIVAVGVVKFGSAYFAPQIERKPLAVVNFEKLVQEYIMGLSEQVSKGAVPVSEMTVKSSEFTKDLQQRLRVYAESGTTVLRSDVVIVAPDELLDITETIRSDLVKSGYLPKEPVKTGSSTVR